VPKPRSAQALGMARSVSGRALHRQGHPKILPNRFAERFTSAEVVYRLTGTDVTGLPKYGTVKGGGHLAIPVSQRRAPHSSGGAPDPPPASMQTQKRSSKPRRNHDFPISGKC
jgi:hypothetical protein